MSSFDVWTYWRLDCDEHGEPKPVDMDRHERYAQMVVDMVQQCAPEVAALLAETGLSVAAAPGRFFVCTPDGLHFVPELSAHLNLTPWAEPGESCH